MSVITLGPRDASTERRQASGVAGLSHPTCGTTCSQLSRDHQTAEKVCLFLQLGDLVSIGPLTCVP